MASVPTMSPPLWTSLLSIEPLDLPPLEPDNIQQPQHYHSRDDLHPQHLHHAAYAPSLSHDSSMALPVSMMMPSRPAPTIDLNDDDDEVEVVGARIGNKRKRPSRELRHEVRVRHARPSASEAPPPQPTESYNNINEADLEEQKAGNSFEHSASHRHGPQYNACVGPTFQHRVPLTNAGFLFVTLLNAANADNTASTTSRSSSNNNNNNNNNNNTITSSESDSDTESATTASASSSDDDSIESIREVVDLTDESNPLLRNSPPRQRREIIRTVYVQAPPPEPAQPEPIKPSCPICLNECRSMSATKCGHVACYDCLLQAVELHKRCPTCRAKAAVRDIRRIFL